MIWDHSNINRSVAHVPILYHLKTPENQRFSGKTKDFLLLSGGTQWDHWS